MRAMTHRAICLLLVTGGLFVLSGASCVESVLPVIVPGEPTDGTTNPGGETSLADEVIAQVNTIRTANGLPTLQKNDLLSQAATGHAQRMAELNFFAHTDPFTGTEPWDRAGQAGYSWSLIAENLAAGQPTPQAVMDGWMGSPGHRTNILLPDAKEIGVGIYEGGAYGIYWVQLFGAP